MSDKPKVSIVIPTYNHLECFKRALSSSLEQVDISFEIIVTDDSDDCKIQDYISKVNDNRIKYYKNPTRLGSPENWNEGIRKATGEYIKILHQDDWFFNENSLSKFVNLLDENPESYFAYAKSINVDIETGKIKRRNPKKYLNSIKKDCFLLFFNNRIGSPSVTIFRNNGRCFDKNLKWVVDIDFYIASLLKNNNIAYCDEVLINIGISQYQITNSCLNNKQIEIYEQFYLFDKYKHLILSHQKFEKELKKLLNRFNIKTFSELIDIIPEKMVPVAFQNKLSKSSYLLNIKNSIKHPF